MKLVPRSHSAKHLSFILTKLQLIQAIEKINKRIREKVVLSDRKDRVRYRAGSHTVSIFITMTPDSHNTVTFTINSFPLSPELQPPLQLLRGCLTH